MQDIANHCLLVKVYAGSAHSTMDIQCAQATPDVRSLQTMSAEECVGYY